MYAQITRRTPDRARQQAIRERAAREFFPKLQQAPGFVAFYLVAGEDGQNTAIVLWEDRARAEAFQGQQQAWSDTLEEMGSRRDSGTAGEVTTHVTPQA